MNKLPLIAAMALFSTLASATEGDILNVTVRSVATIGTAFGQHLAGNFEVTFDGAYQLPTGVICDTMYFTTKRANDPDRLLFNMLLRAKEQKLKIGVRVTDSAALQAYPGRCSIMSTGYSY